MAQPPGVAEGQDRRGHRSAMRRDPGRLELRLRSARRAGSGAAEAAKRGAVGLSGALALHRRHPPAARRRRGRLARHSRRRRSRPPDAELLERMAARGKPVAHQAVDGLDLSGQRRRPTTWSARSAAARPHEVIVDRRPPGLPGTLAPAPSTTRPGIAITTAAAKLVGRAAAAPAPHHPRRSCGRRGGGRFRRGLRRGPQGRGRQDRSSSARATSARGRSSTPRPADRQPRPHPAMKAFAAAVTAPLKVIVLGRARDRSAARTWRGLIAAGAPVVEFAAGRQPLFRPAPLGRRHPRQDRPGRPGPERRGLDELPLHGRRQRHRFPPRRADGGRSVSLQPLSGRHVAVLLGGLSSEREVSLVSGRECADALERLGAKVSRVDAGRDLAQVLAKLKPDVCFNALHGEWGEDGCVQGVLETLAAPLHPLAACWPRPWPWTRPRPRPCWPRPAWACPAAGCSTASRRPPTTSCRRPMW